MPILNTQDERGWTALMEAVKWDRLEVVRFLVGEGAELNVQDERGWTALVQAVRKGDLEMVRLLVENGADVNTQTNNGEIGLDKSCADRRFGVRFTFW